MEVSFLHITSIVLVDYFAVVVGVVMGAIYAVSRRLDVVGTVAMALLTGFGGGVIRDVLLHDQGFFFMEHPWLILGCIICAVMVFYLAKHLSKIERALDVADAFSVALFALAGVSKAWGADVGCVYTVLLGTITAVGGGALASISIGETPRIFRASSYYAIAALCGSVSFCLCLLVGLDLVIASFACVGVCLFMRWVSVRFKLSTKSAE